MDTLKTISSYSRSGVGQMATERHHLIYSLFEQYIEMYASRDDRLTTHFSDNFSGYAGSSDVLVTDKAEWIRVTRQDFAQIPERIGVEMLDLSLQDLAEDIVIATAFFHIHLPTPENSISNETARLTLVFRHEQTSWKITYSGISILFGLAKEDEVYPITRLKKRNIELEHLIKARTKELAEANKLLQIQSNTDGLTNISNRRHFDNVLNQEWNRGQRSNTPLAVIMLDIDHFKKFNDLYGHLAGDNCLQRLAQRIDQSLGRAGEFVARYGGEEFIILLPNTDQQTALKMANNIRNKVISLKIPHATSSYGIVTVSLGVASVQPSSQELSVQLVGLADAALYRAKVAGRNCVQGADSTTSIIQ